MTAAVAHSTWVKAATVPLALGGRGRRYYAKCVCGWQGPLRIGRPRAADDAWPHLQEHAR